MLLVVVRFKYLIDFHEGSYIPEFWFMTLHNFVQNFKMFR